MRRIKLAGLLPLAQLVLAIILLSWVRHYPHPPVRIDSPWAPTAERLVEGINLPAARIVEMALDVFPWTSTDGPGIGRFHFVEWMFICGVVGLWYLVGRKLDNYQIPKPNTKRGQLVRTECGMCSSRSTVSICLSLYHYTMWFLRTPRTGQAAMLTFLAPSSIKVCGSFGHCFLSVSVRGNSSALFGVTPRESLTDKQ